MVSSKNLRGTRVQDVMGRVRLSLFLGGTWTDWDLEEEEVDIVLRAYFSLLRASAAHQEYAARLGRGELWCSHYNQFHSLPPRG